MEFYQIPSLITSLDNELMLIGKALAFPNNPKIIIYWCLFVSFIWNDAVAFCVCGSDFVLLDYTVLTAVQPVKLTPSGLWSLWWKDDQGHTSPWSTLILAYIKPFPLRAEETGVSSIAKHNWWHNRKRRFLLAYLRWKAFFRYGWHR